MARALSRRGYGDRIVLDVHLYQVFAREEQSLSVNEHIAKVEDDWRLLLDQLREHVPVIVGEWSAALPPAAERETRNQEYFKAQQTLFDSFTWAHSYWSYKAPGSGAWGYQARTDFYSK